MLINRGHPGASARIADALARMPVLDRVLDVFDAAPERFEIAEEVSGLELKPADSGVGPAGRCRMKLFTPREGSERLCAFFYKRSNLAWSRDRFSYGGVEFLPERLTEEEIRSWLAWLVSGFDPEARPERLRRAFLYDIPD